VTADAMQPNGDGQIVFEDDVQRLVHRRVEWESLATGGGLEALLVERLRECQAVFDERNWARTPESKYPIDATPFTDLWYAAQVASKCAMLLEKCGEQYGTVDILRTVAMAEIWNDWQWRKAFGREMVLGKQKRTVGKVWSDARNTLYELETTEIVRRMDAQIARGRNASEAARSVKRDMGLSAQPSSVVRRFKRATQKR